MNSISRAAYPALGLIAGMIACLLAIVYLAFASSAPVAAQGPCDVNICILATPTPDLPVPAPGVAAFAAPNGGRMGDIPADTPIKYRDSRNPGWVGVDWQGAVVWVQADGDASALQDLAPPMVAPTAAPAQQQPVAAVGCFDRAELYHGVNVIVVCAPTVEERDRLWNERAATVDAPVQQEQPPLTEAERAEAERRSYEALQATIAEHVSRDAGLPQPGEDGFVESFQEPGTVDPNTFRPAGCSPFVGYLPNDPCYRKP